MLTSENEILKELSEKLNNDNEKKMKEKNLELEDLKEKNNNLDKSLKNSQVLKKIIVFLKKTYINKINKACRSIVIFLLVMYYILILWIYEGFFSVNPIMNFIFLFPLFLCIILFFKKKGVLQGLDIEIN